MNRKTFGKFILQRRKSEGCNQVSLKIMWRKSGKNAGFRGKTAFKVFNGLALPWKTIRAGNEAANKLEKALYQSIIENGPNSVDMDANYRTLAKEQFIGTLTAFQQENSDGQ